jgi:hypothetical protein
MRYILGTAATALALASPAAAATFTVLTDRTAFESALTNIVVEDFDDGSVDAPFSVISDAGSVAGGLWADRVDPGGDQTTFSFAQATLGFGGDWDLAPEGAGTGIAVTVEFAGGGSQAVGTEIPNTTTGFSFWGFTSDMAFTSVTLTSGTVPNIAETYEMDNMTISPIPLPAAAWLLGGGLIALGGFGRRRA